jgi:hypothetical protein
MRPIAIVLQMLIRLVWLTLITLGALFWAGRALELVRIHMDLGVIFVILLWLLSALALFARADLAMPLLLIVWGAIVMGYGMAMPQLVSGRNSLAVGIGHLLVGIIAVGLGEMVAVRVKRRSVGANTSV